MATDNARAELGEAVTFGHSALQTATKADAVVIATEWNEFRDLDWTAILEVMQGNVLVDGRNLHDPDRMVELGYRYFAMGRQDPDNVELSAD